jgi:hypothetical protein
MRSAAPACLAALLLSAPQAAPALEFPLEHLLWIAPDGSQLARPAVATLPPGWQVGDAAAILLIGQGTGRAMRTALRAALLSNEAAVLEPPGDACGEALLPWLSAASTALREALGAGLQVAIALDCKGEAILRAAAVPLAAAGPVAMVAIQDGKADFAPGIAPPPEEGWPLRAPILCRLVVAVSGAARTIEHCLARLLPRPILAAGR